MPERCIGLRITDELVYETIEQLCRGIEIGQQIGHRCFQCLTRLPHAARQHGLKDPQFDGSASRMRRVDGLRILAN
jgi:hypothetical protein